MNARQIAILLLSLAPCASRAQQNAVQRLVNVSDEVEKQKQPPILARVGDAFEVHLSASHGGDGDPVSGLYTVDGDGMIKMPYIGSLKVASLTLGQIQDLIQSRYIKEKVFLHPGITVKIPAKDQSVIVMGDVKSPQRIPYTAQLTLMDAITACGGFYGIPERIELIRGRVFTMYNAIDIKKNNAVDQALRPGDRIVVHQGPF